ncbi:hypothetical protein SAMN02745163_00875 [Clostridium cavendishii DSM 21758]|uniref:Uncharacterized protein n=1 Tax=Clostridium cavendishii DSM 21758 TaxID=1121302 RepID=A0A1M6EL36_9CLOT|nr:hypothetical protein [Clostridium cavendishii]SHI85998.1 hypothetical protein SAMN02745163_00875 [Clostridium cavendishii DSM 21758]
MSRHKHRSREFNGSGNNMMNNLGINPQMLEMLGLGNIDMNQLSGLFGNMGQEGFNINNLGALAGSFGLGNTNNGSNQSPMGGMNPLDLLGSLLGGDQRNTSSGNTGGFNSNLNFNQGFTTSNNSYSKESDPNIAMLKAIRSMVNSDRAKFLDKVMEMYQNGEIKY